MNRKRVLGKLFAGAVLLCILSPAFSAVFSVGPGSGFDISGDLNVTISAPGLSSSGFGNVAEQGAAGSGSLHSNLSGSLDADVSTSNITFLGGNTFTALPSGNWQPSGLPAPFGFQVELPLNGLLTGHTVKVVADIRNLSFFFTGSKALSGLPGNQTFDTAGLELTTLGGTFDLQAFDCTSPTTCTDLGTTTIPPDNSGPPDVLPSGNGALALVGNRLTLTVPVSITAPLTDSQTVDVDGTQVTVDLTGNVKLAGNVVASIPEPSAWAMLCVGLAGIGLIWPRRRRGPSSYPSMKTA